MKITLLVSSLNSGGAERVAATLCNAWAERGDEVTLISTFMGGSGSFYKISSGVKVIYLSNVIADSVGLIGYISKVRYLRSFINNFGPDVVVSFLPNVNIVAIISLFFCRVPLVVCERSDPTRMPIERSLGFARFALYRYASALVVQTESVRSKIGRVCRPPRVLAVVPNPLPCIGAADGLRIVPIARGKILISVGRLSEEKQVHRMIDAFASNAQRFPDWIYKIYGEGPLRQALEQQILRLNLVDRIQLMGNTTEPWAAMSAADAFIMASRFEGFPNALLEAMGLGLPCVVFDCESGPREITRHGRDALLVSLNDQEGLTVALRRLMEDEGLRCILGERAKNSVSDRYQIQGVLGQWDKVFRAVGVEN